MEAIKANWATVESMEGKIIIRIYDELQYFYPSRQTEINDIELSFDGAICTMNGTRRFYENYYDKKYISESQGEQFDDDKIQFIEKKVWNWFKPNGVKKFALLSGWIRLKETEPFLCSTPLWEIRDMRKSALKEVYRVMDEKQMD